MKFFEKVDFIGTKTEFIGTFVILYCSGWAWMNYSFKNSTLMEVGITDFLVYTLFIWAGYPFSGGLYNPAVTGLLMLLKKISVPKGVGYLIGQLIASLLAASLLKMIAPNTKAGLIKANKFVGFYDFFGDGGLGKWIVITVYEAIGTAFIVIVYYMTVFVPKKKNHFQGMAIGSAYGCMTMSIGALTGAAINPAKIIGPGVVGQSYWVILPYLAGQLGGALFGGIFCEFFLFGKTKKLSVLLGLEDDDEELNPEDYIKKINNEDSFIKRKNNRPDDTMEIELKDDSMNLSRGEEALDVSKGSLSQGSSSDDDIEDLGERLSELSDQDKYSGDKSIDGLSVDSDDNDLELKVGEI